MAGGKNSALMDRRDPSIHLGGGNGGTTDEEGCENVRGKFLTGRAIYNLGGGTPRGFKLAGFRGSRGVVLYATCVGEAVSTAPIVSSTALKHLLSYFSI